MGGIVRDILRAKEHGMMSLGQIADALAGESKLPREFIAEYLSEFSYEFGETEQDSLAELLKYAYFHGVLPDVPDLSFFDVGPMPSPSVH
jgi:predicted solute-binding protein